MNLGSTSPVSRSRDPWALARTTLVVAGLGFVSATLAVACLDHYDEDWGCAETPDGGADCDASTGAIDAATGSGSGSGFL